MHLYIKNYRYLKRKVRVYNRNKSRQFIFRTVIWVNFSSFKVFNDMLTKKEATVFIFL